jgi:signal transduction histidine kinase
LLTSYAEHDAYTEALFFSADKASTLLLEAQSVARICEVGLAACRELGCVDAKLVIFDEDEHHTSHRPVEERGAAGTQIHASCNSPSLPAGTVDLKDSAGRTIGYLMAETAAEQVREQLEILALHLAVAVENVHALDAIGSAQNEAGGLRQTLLRLREDVDITQAISGTATLRWNYITGKDQWSRNLFACLGYDPETDEPDYQKFLLGAHPEDKAIWFKISKIAVENAEPFRWEGRYYKPDGELRHFLIQGRPDVDTWYHGTLLDVTELKESEERLRRLQLEVDQAARLTALGELAASIAHEINQPLTSISANASASQRWFNREVPNLEQLRASLQAIIQDSQRAGEVIKGLQALDESRPSQHRPRDLSKIVNRVVEVMRPNAILHNIMLRSELESQRFIVKCDQTQVEQLFHNLIRNAIEAVEVTQERSRMVVLRGNAEARALKIMVEDTGPGIDAETSGKLFDPFYTTKPAGMGMGLAICRSIVEAHGGTIRAYPASPYGTVFEVELPLISEQDDITNGA